MVTKLRLVFSISIFFLCFYVKAQNKYWKATSSSEVDVVKSMQQLNVKKSKVFILNKEYFKKKLHNTFVNKNDFKIVYFPDENGNFIPFKVVEKSIMSPELSLKYPEIKSYYGEGLEDKNMRIRFSISHNGIQSMMIHRDKQKATFMQKTKGVASKYLVYNKTANFSSKEDFICETKSAIVANKTLASKDLVNDQILRKYRLAVSASGEYTTYHGGTVEDALAAINATVTRINEVFETDLGISLELIPNNDLIIYTDATTDPFTGSLNSEIQSTLTSVIGEGNYDIGHLFHNDDNNGNAGFVGAVCVDNRKGSAFSSGTTPEGDQFDLDFVSHEMGHQLGANHTWSFESEGTLVQAEPASGTTIMGYAGIVNVNNVAPNGDDYFHYNSILQIKEYLATTSCAVEMLIANNPPVISSLTDYIIPKSTAFALEGTATDSDLGDILTYTWEQIDNGVVNNVTFGPLNPVGANFRSQKPSIESIRYFPKLSSVVEGNLTQTNPTVSTAWETVSDVEREMNFALTVRDNALGGGQVVSDLMRVDVVNAAGPFVVTSQDVNDSYVAGTLQEIAWDVANTNNAPVNAQMVDIFLSVDGGVSFQLQLADDVINDGRQNILLPGITTTAARIMVKASDNIFFAVNASDFIITESEVVLNFSDLEPTVCQPNDVTIPFEYQTYLGFNEEVTFSIPDAPAGLGIVFSPGTASVNTAVDIVLTNISNVSSGVYPLTITATSTTVTKEVILQLNIEENTFSPVNLLSPLNGLIDVAQNQELNWETLANVSAYDIEIATDNLFTNIIETGSSNSNVYQPTNLASEVTYYWRVRPKNSCGVGDFSSPYSFTTLLISCKNIIAKNTPLEISNIGTPTVTSTITFLEDLPISDVNVNLNIEHSYLEDLVISLTSPAGTTVVLTSSSCGDRLNINATFDDDASATFVCGSNLVVDGAIQPSISGIVKPLGVLSSFTGESSLGEWILEIKDTAPSDGGVLNSFSLDICAEGAFRPDADEDGVFDDGDDLCLATPKGVEVNVDGCAVYRFLADNFLVAINSESCINSNNGSIVINPQNQTINYSITTTGNGINTTGNFTDTYTENNLSSGTYTLCITGIDGAINYEPYCFDVVIVEPDPLSVSAKLSLDGKEAILVLDGASLYNIELNGTVLQTTDKEVNLNLKNGTNHLKIYTNLICQGSFEKEYFVSDTPIVYPNPFVNELNIFPGSDYKNIKLNIYTIEGQLIYTRNYTELIGEINIDLSSYSSGVYFVTITTKRTQKFYKVIKK